MALIPPKRGRPSAQERERAGAQVLGGRIEVGGAPTTSDRSVHSAFGPFAPVRHARKAGAGPLRVHGVEQRAERAARPDRQAVSVGPACRPAPLERSKESTPRKGPRSVCPRRPDRGTPAPESDTEVPQTGGSEDWMVRREGSDLSPMLPVKTVTPLFRLHSTRTSHRGLRRADWHTNPSPRELLCERWHTNPSSRRLG